MWFNWYILFPFLLGIFGYLKSKSISNMIYYPVPLYKQLAYAKYSPEGFELPNTEILCDTVLSLPMHSELSDEQLEYITKAVIEFFN